MFHAAAAIAGPRWRSFVVNVANQRRNVMLPAFLAYYHLASATVDDGWLRVRFEPEAAAV